MRASRLQFVFPLLLPFAVSGSVRLNFYEGAVTIDGQTLTRNDLRDLAPGALLTTPAGRAELFIQEDVFLRIGQNSSVRVLTEGLGGVEVELMSGSAALDSTRAAKVTPITIRMQDSAVRVIVPGEYRFDAAPPRMKIYRGSADVVRGQVPTGTTARGDDLLDIWSTNRRIHLSTSFASPASPRTVAKAEPPPPVETDEDFMGPNSSLGFLYLTGIPELMFIPQHPYRVGAGFFGPVLEPGYFPYPYAAQSLRVGPPPTPPEFTPYRRGLAFPGPAPPHIGRPVIGH